MRRLQLYTSRWPILLAAFVLLAFCSTDAGAAKEIPPPMQERVEAVFDRLTTVIVSRHPEVAQYTIAAVTEKTPNAWINRNNEIYVTTGLLQLLTKDDQLAGVIGHEIAHGTEGHIPHRVSQSLWSAFAVVALGAWAGNHGTADWGGLLHMRDLFMYAFSREQESEADLVGMRYAKAAGYDSEGLVEALRLMDRDRRRLPADSVWQDLYRTHPPIAQRIADLRLVLATERLHNVPLRGTLSPLAAGARSEEEAARGFARALLSGDEDGMRPFVLPGRAGQLLADAAEGSGTDSPMEVLSATVALQTDPAWSTAEMEVVARLPAESVAGDSSPTDAVFSDGSLGGGHRFSVIFVVRMWRPASVAEVVAGEGAGRDGAEVVSPPLVLALQQSARGWVVTGWEVGEESLLTELFTTEEEPLTTGLGRGPLR